MSDELKGTVVVAGPDVGAPCVTYDSATMTQETLC